MNFCGFTDSLATLARPPNECPHCHVASHIANGLCLGCLLQTGVADDDLDGDNFDAALDAVAVPDTHWRLGNYEILEEIGRGGMGVIYRARQRHSRRIVALKRVLSYHADSRDTLARFRREAEAAASLDHPNILPIYEVSQSEDGVPFFSMKLALGGSLQEIGPALRDNPRESVRQLAKVARAVQYAHRQGILHRDLKPGNVLLDGSGEPLVSDFGLAKWLDASSDLTRTLTIFGTPGYIAPEQADGPAASLRPTADVYSLGAILFDLLAGRPPFLGEHALAVIRQAAEKPAPKLRSLVRGADRDLETICARCLEREPRARYPSAGDLAEDLERWMEGRPITARPVSSPVKLWRWSKRNPIVAASLAASLIIGSIGIARQFQTRRLSATLRQDELAAHSIAVLPFLDLDLVQADTNFASAISKSLQADLSQLGPTLTTVAGVDAASRGAVDVEDITSAAKSSKSRTVLTGTKRSINGKIRVSLRLVNGANGELLFRQTSLIDSNDNVRSATSLAAHQIYSVLDDTNWSGLPLANADFALRNPDARDFINSARELQTHRTIADSDRAIECLRKAITAEPTSALARGLLAMAQVGRSYIDPSPGLLESAEASAREALKLNPHLGEAHRALANLLFTKGDFSQAMAEVLESIEVDGLQPVSASLVGFINRSVGRPDKAIGWFQIAKHWHVRPSDFDGNIGDCWADLSDDKHAELGYQRLCEFRPELPDGWMGICRLRLLEKNFAAARDICERQLSHYKEFGLSAQLVAEVAFFTRDYQQAETLYDQLASAEPGGGAAGYGGVTYQSALGRLHVIRGDEVVGRSMLDDALQKELEALKYAPQNPDVLYRVAAIEASLGNSAGAFRHLRGAFENGWIDYRSAALDPRFDSLTPDPEFSTLLASVADRVESLKRTIRQN